MYARINVDIPSTIMAACAWLYLTRVLGLTTEPVLCIMALGCFTLSRVPDLTRWLAGTYRNVRGTQYLIRRG